MTQSGDVAVRLDGTRKTYGNVVAVDRVDLDIQEDEFFTMLGPSGSGKTTCLRMIAGFERPDEGAVELGGRDVTNLPPYERDVNTVFQDYALFPHMSVGENVEYGLRVAGAAREERRRRTAEALELVRLGGYEKRRPGQLSGGQRQRVALARALVNRLAALAVSRYRFFGRETISFLIILPLALPGIVTGMALNATFTQALEPFGVSLGLFTIIVGHATFCIVVIYNNVVARLRRTGGSLEDASSDLGASTW